jgi:hypothetical protein
MGLYDWEGKNIPEARVAWVFNRQLSHGDFGPYVYWFTDGDSPVIEAYCNEKYDSVPQTIVWNNAVWQLDITRRDDGKAPCQYDGYVKLKQCDPRNCRKPMCAMCEQSLDTYHGNVYLGDGWITAVYRKV